MSELKEAVVVSGARTPIGKFGGSFKDVHSTDLAAYAVKEALKRGEVKPESVDELIIGNVGQIAENGFIGRVVSLKSDLPDSTTAYSVNRQCGSGMQSIVDGMMQIQTGNSEVVVASGTENMSQLPYYLKGARFGYKMGHGDLEDGLLSILTWPSGPYHNGVTAENVAEEYDVSRQEQDEFSLKSQERAVQAIKDGKFKDEIVPVEVKDKKGNVSIVDTDEHPREGLTMEKLGKIKPAFKKDGSVTPANSSGINDGAAAVVLMSKEKAEELGVKPLLKIKGFSIAGNDPGLMGYAPKLSTEKLAEKCDVDLDDVDIYELNEAFASQSCAVIRDLKLDSNKVNVNGGAISLGHPVGATGTILTVKLMYEMHRAELDKGIVTMCIGGGQGISTLFERC
ncbi:thiolase family protein [Lentibacillus amyloliquefaciens]|uniref:acetyl-CoA C-acetyltransferase n=1 Tax=Lentibacillus amyloliquefaciens TaxID=1472767 RepID=A0A0U3WBH1_9BACI|nr:thiolase family protein [Lentibacillus amyloliquefaciens]ALX50400.1 acetyl-CoA acetyltransferase [Lentibacillus amyloliquefaciens]